MEKNKDERKKLIDAFSSDKFQSDVNQYRFSIEAEIIKYLEWLQKELEPTQKFFLTPESRIKSKAGFAEKINRKDYIHKWEVGGNQQSIYETILKRLPDLIGFRITCYFMKDEKILYDKLKAYYEQGRFKNISLDFDEGTSQKNGHPIYKVSGLYRDKVSFELQIKAMVHNVWGEVEHGTIYKGRHFTIDSERQHAITEEIFNVLQASDKQLLALFTHEYSLDNLVFALFTEQVRKDLVDFSDTDYLAVHFESFKSVFFASCRSDIFEFVSDTLVNRPYTKKIIKSKGKGEKEEKLLARIKAEFIEYYLQIQYCIAKELYVFVNYDEFLLCLAEILMNKLATDEDLDEGSNFSEEDESENIKNDEIDDCLNFLEDKLPNARKERE